jgi:hypothetical protein
MPVILIKDAKARKLPEKPPRDEEQLRKYIVDNPECLPLDEIEEGLRLLVVGREFAAGSGSIDALGLDSEGNIYILETKLYLNSDRRRVLAQVLDYDAGLWRGYRSGAEFITKVEENAQRTLKRSVRDEIQTAFGLDPDGTSTLLNRAAENVAAGRIQFVVLMDHIDEDLKTLIAFVNANSEFTIYGVELEFYELDSSATLAIPRLYGAEATRTTSHGPNQVWDEKAFFKQASSSVAPDVVSAMSALYEFSREEEPDEVSWGRGATGSFNPKFYAASSRSMYTVFTDGRLYVNFQWLRRKEGGRVATDTLAAGLRAMGFVLQTDFADRFVRLDATWWVPRIEQLEKLLGSAVAAARSNAV